MVEDNQSFASSAPMLFGEKFAKQPTTTVEQVKAMKKLNVPQEKKFFHILSPNSPAAARVEPRGVIRDITLTGEVTRQANLPAIHKQLRTKEKML